MNVLKVFFVSLESSTLTAFLRTAVNVLPDLVDAKTCSLWLRRDLLRSFPSMDYLLRKPEAKAAPPTLILAALKDLPRKEDIRKDKDSEEEGNTLESYLRTVGACFRQGLVGHAGPEARFYDGLTGYVFSTGRPLLLKCRDDRKKLAEISPRLHHAALACNAFPEEAHASFIAVPLFSARSVRQDGEQVIGVLQMAGKAARAPRLCFDRSDLGKLTKIAGELAFRIEYCLRAPDMGDLMSGVFALPNPSLEPENWGKERPPMLCPDEGHVKQAFMEEGNPYCKPPRNPARRVVETLARRTVEALQRVIGGHISFFWNGHGDGSFYSLVDTTVALSPKQRIDHLRELAYLPHEGKTGRAIATRRSVLIKASPTVLASAKIFSLETEEARSFLATPILDSHNRVRGVIRAARPDTDQTLCEVDQFILETFAEEWIQRFEVLEALCAGMDAGGPQAEGATPGALANLLNASRRPQGRRGSLARPLTGLIRPKLKS